MNQLIWLILAFDRPFYRTTKRIWRLKYCSGLNKYYEYPSIQCIVYTGDPLLRVKTKRLSKFILDTCKCYTASMILLESGSGSIEWENDQITYDMKLSFLRHAKMLHRSHFL